jgi:hypothetical protein
VFVDSGCASSRISWIVNSIIVVSCSRDVDL